jgi:signal transduction histidine kinase/CheY-like chemotaxis protein
MRMLFEGAPVATVAATVFAFALAWHLRPLVPEASLEIWLAAKCLVALPRVIHGLMFTRRRSDSLAWMTWGRCLLLLDGIAWGSAGILLVPSGDFAGMTILAASLCGVATIATFVIHTDWKSCVLFTAPSLLPLIGRFFFRLDSFGLYGACAILTFLVLLLTAARRSERHVVELLTLRFENASLTTELSTALEKSNRESQAKDLFFANMSHELRTPLHGILGLARALAASVKPADRPAVKLIRKSGEHLLGLINNVLEFSRFEAQGIDVRPQEIDLPRTIDETVAMCVPNAVDRKIDLTSELQIALPCVALIDPFRLRQVLLNLIGNAVKFTDPGGSVHVEAQELNDGKEISIAVVDTGIGMDAAAVSALFQPFSQGDTSSTRRYGGTGLGLNITRSICRQMGGEVTCTSTLGKGSTFTVVLPLTRVAQKPPASLGVTRPDPLPLDEGRAGATVLLAEDNEVNTLVAKFALQRLGVDVVHVETGAAVVEHMCMAGRRPDLVLLDCQMPVMDGFEAARRIREFELLNGLQPAPLVALTANIFQSDRDKCREAGMNAFLAKPFSEEQLRDVLRVFGLVPKPAAGSEPDSSYAALLL